MKGKSQKTLFLIFKRPVSGSIRWEDVLELFADLGATFEKGTGSRVGVRLFGERRVAFTDLIYDRTLYCIGGEL